MLWKTISSARTEVGVLWFPALSLDAFGRDWAGFSLPLNFNLPATSVGINTSTWTTVATITAVLPKNWADDLTFDTGLNVKMSLTIDVVASGGSLDDRAQIRINGGDNTPLVDGSETVTLTKTVSFSTARQALVIESLQPDMTAATSIQITKTLSGGPLGLIEAVKA